MSAEVLASCELQLELTTRLKRACENLGKEPRERRTRGFIIAKQKEFDRLLNQLDETHKYIYSNVPAASRASIPYLEKQIYDVAHDYIMRALIKLEEWYDQHAVANPPSTVANDTINNSMQQRPEQLRLPRIKIETFSGNYSNWITFKNLYTNLVHSKENIPAVEKFHHLLSSLSGEPKNIISHYAITEQNYTSAWETLVSRYDNKRLLVNNELKTLLNLPKVTYEAANPIKRMVDSIKQCTNALENLNINITTWDPILIYIFVQKIDAETHRQWQYAIKDPKALPTLKEFLQFLEYRFQTLENVCETQRSDTQRQQYTGNMVRNTQRPNRPFNRPYSSDAYNRNQRTRFSNGQTSPYSRPLSNSQTPSTSNPNNPFRTNTTRNNTEISSNLPRTFHVNASTNCPICNEQHNILDCQQFRKTNIEQRRTAITAKGLCTNCLKNHPSDECRSSGTCKDCHRRHHTLLHLANHTNVTSNHTNATNNSANATNNITSQPSTSAQSSYSTHLAAGKTNSTQVLLATALVKIADVNGTHHKLRCLLDQGSQVSFITKSAMQFLKIKSTSINATISGIGASDAANSKALANLQVESIYTKFKLPVTALVLQKITDHLPSNLVTFSNEWSHIQGLELADPQYFQPAKIDLLLGADVYSSILMEGVRTGINGSPLAQRTQLGWILSGKVHPPTNESSNQFGRQIISMHHKVDIDAQLRAFWEMEEIPEKRVFTEEEEQCEKMFVEQHQRDEKGRFIVSLPFKNEHKALGQSRYRASLRLQQLKKKFDRSESFQREYEEVIEDYKQKGHLMAASTNESVGYYMPHHAVIKEASTTTKLRVVFDASAKTTTGESLNDQLLVGPTLQQDLASILIRWRIHDIVLSADITQMYRQIWVNENDTKFQKILWHGEQQNIVDYELQTLTFGTSSAAYLAVRSLQQLAIENKYNEHISKIVLNDFYVDDLLTGADNIKEAIDTFHQVNKLLATAGFELRKWVSNSTEVLEEIPQSMREIELPLSLDNEKTTKTLGMHFQPSNDQFQFKVFPFNTKAETTKRNILSDTARLFDPLGLLAPITIKSKIFLQTLWQQGYEWDQKITGTLSDDWLKFRKELKELENIKINRWLGRTAEEHVLELHGFCDASEKAFAAAIYSLCIDTTGNIHTTLIASKTRVAPLKSISLPRLELCGAVLLAKLITFTKNALQLKVKVHAWTDSEIVLAWLSTQPTKLKTFVANRVVEIGKHTDVQQWRHVASKQNPADCASRGLFPTELQNHTLWWVGPDWLSNNIWRAEPTAHKFSTVIDTKPVIINAFHSYEEKIKIIERYSSLTVLLRTIATILRFGHNCKNTANRRTGALSTDEINNATMSCLKIAQWHEFKREIADLEANNKINNKSRLLAFNPFIDQHSILRVGGRIIKAEISFNQKHPIILPSSGHLTKLIVNDAHIATTHGGVQLITCLLRKRYWVLKSRSTIKKILNRCVTCHKHSKCTPSQIMAPLPSYRLQPSRPFTHTGVDYAGPIDVRVSKGRGTKSYKGYIALFVCMATKAIHIEVVSDMTTEAYLAAFKRFVGRRGLPSDVYSDNGTNFVGADRVLQKLFKASIKNEDIINAASIRGVKWHFIPARSPHFGGIWEAGIKQMKRHLIKTIGNSNLTFEELTTVLIQIEATLNSRPLIPLTEDPEDFAALSPGHFLIGNELLAPPTEHTNANETSLTKWRRLTQLHQQFWNRWSNEYITGMQQRSKWRATQRDVKIGDMALLKEEHLPPNRWRLCRVENIHPGLDDHVRVVTLRTPTGTFKRAITKIALLPIDEDTTI